MAGGQPGSNSRGRGGKFKKYTRGGGKHFSRDIRSVDADGNEVSMWSTDVKPKDDASSEEESNKDSGDDSDEGSDSENDDLAQPEMTRAERKAAAKARKDAAIAKKRTQAVEVGDLPPSDSEESSEDEADMPANPNHSKAARNQTKVPVATPEVDAATEGVKKLAVANNRKERESIEAAQAKERYRKLQEAGKTDEAKADLARLRLIREQRAADAARREAEREEREAQEAAKRKEVEAKEAKKREAALGPVKKGKKSSK